MGPKTGGPNCEGRRRVERLLWALLVRRVRSPVPAAESTERECYVDDTPGTLRLSEHKGTNWSTRAIPTAGALGALRRLALTPQSPALRAGAPAGREERDETFTVTKTDAQARVIGYGVYGTTAWCVCLRPVCLRSVIASDRNSKIDDS
jgi:hypothetical protein